MPDSGGMEAMDRLMDRFWPLGWCVAAGALVGAGQSPYWCRSSSPCCCSERSWRASKAASRAAQTASRHE